MSEFIPTDHNLAQVRDHLAGADVEEVARVKALESESETPRKGVLEWVPRSSDLEPDADGYTRVLVEDPYAAGEPIERPEGDET